MGGENSVILYIELNKFNQVFRCSTQKTEDFLEIETDVRIEDILNYCFLNNKLTYRPITKDYPIEEQLPHEWNGSDWVDVSSPKEKQDFYKSKMIETNNQIKELKEIGLGGGSEESSLRAKLEEYRKQYMNAVQEEAIEIDRGMAN